MTETWPREAESIRDVPASCSCLWLWDASTRRYRVDQYHLECAWHQIPTVTYPPLRAVPDER